MEEPIAPVSLSNPTPHLSPVIIGVIVTALVVGFGIYWFVMPVSAPTPSVSPRASVDTEGWETYINEQYGFEFQYPKEKKSVEGNFDGGKSADWYIYIEESSGDLTAVVSVNNKINYGPLVQDGTIAGDGVVFDRKYAGVEGDIQAKNAPSVYQSEKGNIDIVTDYKNRTLVEQIISTFRFTAPTGTATATPRIQTPHDISFVTIEEGSYGGEKTKKQITIKTQSAWQNEWTAMKRGESPTPTLPLVDFDRYMLVAVFMGERNTGGHGIAMTKITETNTGLVVAVNEVSPGNGCMVTQALTQPYHVVQIPKSNKPVTFTTSRSVTQCN